MGGDKFFDRRHQSGHIFGLAGTGILAGAVVHPHRFALGCQHPCAAEQRLDFFKRKVDDLIAENRDVGVPAAFACTMQPDDQRGGGVVQLRFDPGHVQPCGRYTGFNQFFAFQDQLAAVGDDLALIFNGAAPVRKGGEAFFLIGKGRVGLGGAVVGLQQRILAFRSRVAVCIAGAGRQDFQRADCRDDGFGEKGLGGHCDQTSLLINLIDMDLEILCRKIADGFSHIHNNFGYMSAPVEDGRKCLIAHIMVPPDKTYFF